MTKLDAIKAANRLIDKAYTLSGTGNPVQVAALIYAAAELFALDVGDDHKVVKSMRESARVTANCYTPPKKKPRFTFDD